MQQASLKRLVWVAAASERQRQRHTREVTLAWWRVVNALGVNSWKQRNEQREGTGEHLARGDREWQRREAAAAGGGGSGGGGTWPLAPPSAPCILASFKCVKLVARGCLQEPASYPTLPKRCSSCGCLHRLLDSSTFHRTFLGHCKLAGGPGLFAGLRAAPQKGVPCFRQPDLCVLMERKATATLGGPQGPRR